MIVCNTKLSDHAKRYTECRGIEHIGGGHPPDRDLGAMIEAHKIYPVTLLKGVSQALAGNLARGGAVTLGQLVSLGTAESEKFGIDGGTMNSLQKRAKQLLARMPEREEHPGNI